VLRCATPRASARQDCSQDTYRNAR